MAAGALLVSVIDVPAMHAADTLGFVTSVCKKGGGSCGGWGGAAAMDCTCESRAWDWGNAGGRGYFFPVCAEGKDVCEGWDGYVPCGGAADMKGWWWQPASGG